MHAIIQHLVKQKTRYLFYHGTLNSLKLLFSWLVTWLLLGVFLLFFGSTGALVLKAGFFISLILFGFFLIQFIRQILRVANSEKMASEVERLNPNLGYRLQTALDFLKDDPVKTDEAGILKEAFLEQTEGEIKHIPLISVSLRVWRSRFLTALLLFCALVFFRGDTLRQALQGEHLFVGDELFVLHGTLSIYEPDYTGIPGRTLPLAEGTFEAFTGSRIRLHIDRLDADTLYEAKLAQGEESKIVPLKRGDATTFEFLLEQNTVCSILKSGGKKAHSQELIFTTKEDRIPEIQLLGFTPEGEINPRNPIMLEGDIKDDFGVKKLDMVIQWDNTNGKAEPEEQGGEKRIGIQIRPDQSSHFQTRNQWNISDLVPDGTESFSIYLEATDNNPFTGPGVGQSRTLRYGINTPEKQREEFMSLVRELLDAMSYTLADNLVTPWTEVTDRKALLDARDLGNSIQSGLLRSRELITMLLINLRQESMSQTLDSDFVEKFRSRLRRALNERLEMSQIYAQLHYTNQLPASSFQSLRRFHGREESRLEDLVYDLLLQLKLWALMDMEKKQDDIEETLRDLEELLENSEDMEMDQLKKEIDKLMDQLMKEMTEMLQKAAEEMDLSMQEFMNQEAMKNNKDEIDSLKKQLEEALKAGDMEKAKEILEAMKQAMEAMMKSMKQAVGEMSPEMKKMMKAMQELMGLIGALKEGEEKLESETQDLKRKVDEEINSKLPSLEENMQKEFSETIEKIKEILNGLHTRLSVKDSAEWMEPLFDRMGELNVQLRNGDKKSRLFQIEARRLDRDIQFLSGNGLDSILALIIKNLKELDLLDEFLKNMELHDALGKALQIQRELYQGENVSKSNLPSSIESVAKGVDSFHEAQQELQKIIDFLDKLRQMRDQLRSQHLQEQGQNQPQELSQEQFDLENLIPEFMEKYGEDLKRLPMMDQLKSVQQDMNQAGKRLGQNRLNPGLKYEQDALRKLGELQEQMMQMQQGQGQPMMPFPMQPGHKQMGQMGDPTGDLFIPDAEKKARKSELKDQIRKKLQKNLPQSHSKEIKAYYERLMDQ